MEEEHLQEDKEDVRQLVLRCWNCKPEVWEFFIESLVKAVRLQERQRLGSRGGSATKAKYGVEHYRRLAANMNRKRAKKSTKNIPLTEKESE